MVSVWWIYAAIATSAVNMSFALWAVSERTYNWKNAIVLTIGVTIALVATGELARRK